MPAAAYHLHVDQRGLERGVSVDDVAQEPYPNARPPPTLDLHER